MKPQPLIIITPIGPEFLTLIDRGLANGYVAVPKSHPWFGVDYDHIGCNVHGGLTFGRPCNMFDNEYWMIGFDTAHYDDNQQNWPIFKVFDEAMELWKQSMEAY
jgi:hypothetical protein